MSTPKRHHYLPDFYLRGFGEDNRLGVFDRVRNAFRTDQPKNIAVERYYYAVERTDGTKDVRIEEALCGLEGEASRIIAKADGRQAITPDERTTFALFVALLHTRVPQFERSASEITEKATKVTMKAAFGTEERAAASLEREAQRTGKPTDTAPEEMVEFVRGDKYGIKVHRNETLRYMLVTASGLARVFSAMDWTLLHSRADEMPFIATDNPIAVYPPKDYKPNIYGYGMGTTGARKLVPLSKKTCLAIGDLADKQPLTDARDVDCGEALAINLDAVLRCHQYAMGRNEMLMKGLVALLKEMPPAADNQEA